MDAQPFKVGGNDGGDILKFLIQAIGRADFESQLPQRRGGELVVLKLAQEEADFPRKTGQPRGGTEEAQLLLVLRQQGAQDHDTSFFIEQLARGLFKMFQNQICEPFERENFQAGVTSKPAWFENLPLQLKGGLLRGEQDERRAVGFFLQSATSLRNATESLAAAGRTEEKLYLHRVGCTGKAAVKKAAKIG